MIASPASTSRMAGAPADEEPGASASASNASLVQRWCDPGRNAVGPFSSFRSQSGRNTTSEWAGCVGDSVFVLEPDVRRHPRRVGVVRLEVRDHPYTI